MSEETDTGSTDLEKADKGKHGRMGPPQGGSPIYGLGVFGAAVFFWRRADTAGERGLAVLKGLVWPAFMVHEGFSALEQLSRERSPVG